MPQVRIAAVIVSLSIATTSCQVTAWARLQKSELRAKGPSAFVQRAIGVGVRPFVSGFRFVRTGLQSIGWRPVSPRARYRIWDGLAHLSVGAAFLVTGWVLHAYGLSVLKTEPGLTVDGMILLLPTMVYLSGQQYQAGHVYLRSLLLERSQLGSTDLASPQRLARIEKELKRLRWLLPCITVKDES
jgi:hypothetical protein